MTIIANKLRTPVMFQVKTQVVTPVGGVSTVWVDAFRGNVDLIPVNTDEKLDEGKVVAETKALVRSRFTTAILSGMRMVVVNDDMAWEVVSRPVDMLGNRHFIEFSVIRREYSDLDNTL